MAPIGQFPPVLGRRLRERAPNGLIVTAIAAIILAVAFDLSAIASIGSDWWHVAGSLLLGVIAWLLTPYIVLGRRVSWRRLLPGAVMTALGCGVPLLVVPYFATEAAPSADRVVELGLGYRLAPEQLTPEGINTAVRMLAGDNLVRQRVRQMRQDIHAAGGPVRAATAIVDHLERVPRHAAGS